MNICLYGASSTELDARYLDAAYDLGRRIAAGGHTMVYGGGAQGVMGAAARGVVDGGGALVGIAPTFFKKAPGVLFDECSEFIDTKTMAEHHVDPRAVRVFYAETSERRAVVQNLKRQGVALDTAERDGFAENGTSPRNCCDLNCHNWLLLCAPHCAFFSCSISRPCSASCSACSRTTDLSRHV